MNSINQRGQTGWVLYRHLQSELLTIIAAMIGFTMEARAGWLTVEDIPGQPGIRTSARAVGTDLAGTKIFSLGTIGVDTNTSAAAINQSTNSTEPWQNIYLDFLQPGYASGFYGFTVDPANGQLSAGGIMSDSSGAHWFVCQSSDGGLTWSSEPLYQYSTGHDSVCRKLAADGHGLLYAAGFATKANGTPGTWIVRKMENGIWTTVDVQGGGNNPVLGATAITVHPNGSVFVGGALPLKGNAGWTIRRSTDKGATWTTVDNNQLYRGNGRADDLAVDSHGALYAAGFSGSHWIIKKSSTGDAGSWRVIDDQGPYAGARAIVPVTRADNLGIDLYATGYYLDSASNVRWLAKKWDAVTNSWSVIDDFSYDNSVETAPNHMTKDAAGNIYITGYGWDNAGVVPHWLTRMLPAP